MVKLLLNKILFLFRVVEAQEYDHDTIYYETEELNNTIGGKLLFALLLLTRLLILVLVCYG